MSAHEQPTSINPCKPCIADYVYIGDVDMEIVDEDNIDAGDSPVEFDPSWQPAAR